MTDYELTLVFSPTSGAAAKIIEEIDKLVLQAKGKLSKKEEWGKRSLAYPIQKISEGVYHYLELSMPAGEVGRIERRVKIEEGMLRYLLVKADKSKPRRVRNRKVINSTEKKDTDVK